MRLAQPHPGSTLLQGLLRAVVLASLLGGAACGPEQGPSTSRQGAALAEPQQGGFVVLELRAAHYWSNLLQVERGELELGAMFVHHWGGEREDVAQQLGVQLEEPTLSPGTCARGAALFALPLGDFDEDTGEMSVELMDAGSVLFSLPGRSELLGGELFPEVLPNVSGHHYLRVLPLETRSVSTHRVNVLGLGGRDVSAFELAGIRGPSELRFTSLGGWSPADGPALVSVRDPLVLRWSPGQPRFDTLLRLRWAARGSRPAGELLCRPAHPGRFTVPRTWLSRIPIAGRERRVTLTVETTSRTKLDGPLPGGVFLRVSQSDTVSLQVVR